MARVAGTVPRIDPPVDSAPGGRGAVTGLVGRAAECRLIDGLIDDASSGKSRVLVVRGDAGIGKSALLDYAAGVAAARGMRITRAAGVESEMELPFAGLHLLCVPMLAHLEHLPGPQREAMGTAFGVSDGRQPEPLLIGLALLSLLSDAAEDTPLLCVVDDAHWLDQASARALAFAARRLLADRVCLLFGVRLATDDLRGLPELVLDGLDAAGSDALLTSVVSGPIDERVRDRVIAETRGNPLALLEWPRNLSAAELAGGFGLPALLPLAGQLEESFRRRLDELGPTTRRFLTIGAAEPTGDAALVWRAAATLGLSGEDIVPAIGAGLVEVDTSVRFRHPSVRSAVYGAASISDRQEAHRALADATDRALDPDRWAWHLALATPGPDAAVAEELERSASRAQARGALAAAAILLERASAVTVDPVARVRRTIAAAAAYTEAGAYRESAALLTAAEAGSSDEGTRGEIEMLRAVNAMNVGDTGEAADLVFSAVSRFERVAAPLPHAAYMPALSIAVAASDLARHVDLEQVARAVAVAPRPEVPERPHDLMVDGLALTTTASAAEAAPVLRRALDGFSRTPLESEESWWYGHQIAAASALWEYDIFRDMARSQVDTARAQGALRMLVQGLESLAVAEIFAGNLSTAASVIAEAAAILEATESTFVLYGAARLVAVRGRVDEASPVIDAIVERARAHGQGLAVKVAQSARTTLLNGVGRYDDALDAAHDMVRPPLIWASCLTLHELVEAAVRSGQSAAATETMERLSDSARASGTDWALGIETRSRALLSSGETAEVLYLEAIERLDRSPVRPEAARAHLLFGEWLRRANRRVDARGHLRRAYEELSAMGMEAFADRAMRELAATGETVRKRSLGTVRDLTPQEVQIARLAAEGSTNREIGALLFLSARTVEWHLRKVFTKLDLTNRRELGQGLAAAGHLSSAS